MKRSFLVVVLVASGAVACSTAAPVAPVSGTRASAIVAANLASHRPPKPLATAEYRSKRYTILPTGARFGIPSYDGFGGTGYYTRNNAPASGAYLQITNSGTNNVLGIPPSTTVTGTVVLYLEAQISGAAYQITFKPASKTMTLTSQQFLSAATYSIATYLWNEEIKRYSAGSPVNGALTFQTPFSGLTLSYYTPICIEVLQVSNPTLSPTPTS